MRTLVDIRDDQIEWLDGIAARAKWSRAEAIRQAIDLLIAKDREETRKVLDEVSGSWSHLGIDGLEFQRALRAEWDDPWEQPSTVAS